MISHLKLIVFKFTIMWTRINVWFEWLCLAWMNVVYLPALGWKGNPNMAKYIITQGSVKLAWDFSKKKYTSAYVVIQCIYRLRCGLGHSVQEAFDRTKLRVAGAGRGG